MRKTTIETQGNGIAQNHRLIVFTRYPQPGRTKTRLIPALGPAGAADLQRRMTALVLARAEDLAAAQPVAVEVRFEGADVAQMVAWLGPRWRYRPQGEGDIGERMGRAFAEAFAAGAAAVALIGTDIPEISTAILAEAFDRLKDHDIVIGPAADGGYYLIGSRNDRHAELAPLLFEGMAWGTAGVLQATLEALAVPGATIHLLATLRDVDRPEDLAVWEAARQ